MYNQGRMNVQPPGNKRRCPPASSMRCGFGTGHATKQCPVPKPSERSCASRLRIRPAPAPATHGEKAVGGSAAKTGAALPRWRSCASRDRGPSLAPSQNGGPASGRAHEAQSDQAGGARMGEEGLPNKSPTPNPTHAHREIRDKRDKKTKTKIAGGQGARPKVTLPGGWISLDTRPEKR